MTFIHAVQLAARKPAGAPWDGESWRFTGVDGSDWDETTAAGQMSIRIGRVIFYPNDLDGHPLDSWAVGDVFTVYDESNGDAVWWSATELEQRDWNTNPTPPREAIDFLTSAPSLVGGHVYRWERH